MTIDTSPNADKKKRVLLIWFEMPNRPELLEPFVNLSGKFEFIHLNFNTAEERVVNITPFKMIYWFDYATPYKLLNRIKPDVIFSEFPSDLKCIGLAIAAKNSHIPYFGMTHGIYFENSFDITIPNINSVVKVNKYSKYLKILFFYLSSLRVKNLKYLPQLTRLLFYYMKDGYFVALGKVKFSLRWPDRYIVYQMKNSVEIMRDKHGFPQDRLVPIGVPQFDSIFHYWNSYNESNDPGQGYYLMIDTAWIYNHDMPPPDMINATYLKLAEYCKSLDCKLVVKLHPHWYTKTDLPVDDSIQYIRNVPQDNLSQIIIKAKGCFLYFSTLSIPIIPYKNCYFLFYQKLTKDLIDITGLKVAKSLDIARFKTDEIDFDKGFDRTRINEYITDYLFSTDGNATERLGKILADA